MIIKTKSTAGQKPVREPLSLKLKEMNTDLINNEDEVFLLEIDSISEMLINYVKNPGELPLRIDFIDTLAMFIFKYKYFARSENLYIIKIILLNELFKKNQNEPSVMRLIKEEMHFNEKDAAAFKTVIEKELRETCMIEFGIPDRSDPRYNTIVRPLIKDFQNFYYRYR